MPFVQIHKDFLIQRIRKSADAYSFMLYDLPDNAENQHVETPSAILSIPGVTKSNLEAAPDFVPCLKHQFAVHRHINPDTSGGFRASGVNDFSDLMVIIPFEPYVADILKNQYTGKPFDEIMIKTIHWTGGESFESLKEEKFSNNHVIEVTHSRYWSLITFHVRKIDITVFQYDQATGQKQGQNMTSFNYIEDSLAGAPAPAGGGEGAPPAAAPAAAPPPPPPAEAPAAAPPPPAAGGGGADAPPPPPPPPPPPGGGGKG